MNEHAAESQPLKFIVAPHIVQDLGLNLYTSLPRVLVEFVANGYDADAKNVTIKVPKDKIEVSREVVKKEWELEVAKAAELEADSPTVIPLEDRTLPRDIKIVIHDDGSGMSREDIRTKFLRAGRRRRQEDNKSHTDGGRALMGRKGLGKLAGFGVAHVVEVTSRATGADSATKIKLDYLQLIDVTDTNQIPIEETTIIDDSILPDGGTEIVLSNLLYEPMKSRLSTIANAIGDHFSLIDPDDFTIKLNSELVEPSPRKLAWAHPDPEKPVDEFIDAEIHTDDGKAYSFKYRMRFVEDRKALAGSERGVRVYAHKRLAAASSLLDADTNMHGFRMTDYLDGVVIADFIDDQPIDYVATDRQSLRWDSPLLSPLHDFLSEAIKKACYDRQLARDDEKEDEVKNDVYTSELIGEAELSAQERKVAYKMASAISSLEKQGTGAERYKTRLKEVVQGLSQGDLFASLATLAQEELPDLDRVIAQITKLTASEIDGFYKYVKGRIDGIEALRKIVLSKDFKLPNNEDKLHDLLNTCPWLIDPTYFEFLTSNQTEKTLIKSVEKELKVGNATPDDYDKTTKTEQQPGGSNKRPDLVFLLGNVTLSKLVIVELKGPNTPLYGAHYRQLQGYVNRAEKWLKQQEKSGVAVEGILIGSMANIDSRAEDVTWLENEITATRNIGQCRVFSIDKMLERAEDVHRGLLSNQLISLSLQDASESGS